MTQAASHDKYMEDLMRSKILMLCIEQRKLQCVDHTADGVDHATSHQPYKSGGGKVCTSGTIASTHSQPMAM